MKEKSIRFRAAALFLFKGKVLVHKILNRSSGELWFIPPGGGVEYGESSIDALKREIQEELGWETKEHRFINSFESFHLINGIEEHEISFMYFATPVDESVYEIDEFLVVEANGSKQRFRWQTMESLAKPGSLLYPEGLLETIYPT